MTSKYLRIENKLLNRKIWRYVLFHDLVSKYKIPNNQRPYLSYVLMRNKHLHFQKPRQIVYDINSIESRNRATRFHNNTFRCRLTDWTSSCTGRCSGRYSGAWNHHQREHYLTRNITIVWFQQYCLNMKHLTRQYAKNIAWLSIKHDMRRLFSYFNFMVTCCELHSEVKTGGIVVNHKLHVF